MTECRRWYWCADKSANLYLVTKDVYLPMRMATTSAFTVRTRHVVHPLSWTSCRWTTLIVSTSSWSQGSMQWSLPVRTIQWLQMRKDLFPIWESSGGNLFLLIRVYGSRRKSGQLPVTLVLPATFLCMLLSRFIPVSSCCPGMWPRQRPLLSCLLLFHDVLEKNCAWLIVNCRNTCNWETVCHSNTINQLDMACARELHLDICGHNVYQIELFSLSQFPSFWQRRWICVVIILEECVHAPMTILHDYIEVGK